jgi:hypothetical protein
MLQSGRVVFGEMETVVFGRPAADVLAEEARRMRSRRCGGRLAIGSPDCSTGCHRTRRGAQ